MLFVLESKLTFNVSIKKSDEVRPAGFCKISIDMQQAPKLMDKVEPMTSEFDPYNPLICISRVWKSYSVDLTEMERKLEKEKEERRRLEEPFKQAQDSLDAARSKLSAVDMELNAERER